MSTCVAQPDIDDWKKLGRCIRYIRGSKDLGLTPLQAGDNGTVEWYVDASFAVHHDMKSTGIAMTLGKGCPKYVCPPISKSTPRAQLKLSWCVWTMVCISSYGHEISCRTWVTKCVTMYCTRIINVPPCWSATEKHQVGGGRDTLTFAISLSLTESKWETCKWSIAPLVI